MNSGGEFRFRGVPVEEVQKLPSVRAHHFVQFFFFFFNIYYVY